MSGAVRRLVNLSLQLGGQASRVLPNHGVMSRVTSSSAASGSASKGTFAKVQLYYSMSDVAMCIVGDDYTNSI